MDMKLLVNTKTEEDRIFADIGYSREQMKLDLKQFREWLEQQHHLPPSRLKENDYSLQWFLTACKGSMEGAKRKIDNYYTVRSHCNLFNIRDPADPEYLTFRNMCQLAMMPHGESNGNRLVIVRFDDFDPEKYSFHLTARSFINISEMMIRIVSICPRLYLMLDCKGLTSAFALKLSPSILKDLVYLLKEVAPHRIMRLATINTPSYIDVILNNMFAPLLSNKLKERLYVTSGGYEDLLKYFRPEDLPSDYGGLSSNPSLKDYSDLWKKYEQDNREWFVNELSEHTDESKRIIIDGVPYNPYFGVHGSLKKLVLD